MSNVRPANNPSTTDHQPGRPVTSITEVSAVGTDLEIPAQLVNMRRVTWKPSVVDTTEGWKDWTSGVSGRSGLTYVFQISFHPFTGQFEAKTLDKHSRRIVGPIHIGNDEAAARKFLLQRWHELETLP